MANSNGWGDGASNNDIGWGQGADNAIGWGSIYANSWAGATDIVGTPAVDPDAQAFITAASITDPTQQSAINQLVVDLKGYNIWSKMQAIYPMVGGTNSQHSWNLRNTAQYQITWFGGVTSSANGILGNGTNGYGDTGFYFDNTNKTNNHISTYLRTNSTTQACEFGAGENSGTEESFIFRLGNDFLNNQCSNTTGRLTVNSPDSRGLILNSRTSNNNWKTYRNGNILGVNTNTQVFNATSPTSFKLSLFRRTGTNTNDQYSNKQTAFASIGDGLSDTEAANFYTAVQAFQTTLGRSIGTQTVSDADAQAFVTNAGIVDQVEANAVNNLVIGLKADGLWTKMKAVYPMVGGSSSTMKYNLVNPLDTNAAFRLVFNGGWTFSQTGALPNGTNAYADTFFNQTTNFTSTSNASIGVYLRTNNASTGADMGAGDTGSARQGMLIFSSFGGTYYGCAMGDTFIAPAPTNNDSRGFYSVVRNAGVQSLHKRGNITLNVSETEAVGSVTNETIWVGGGTSGGYNFSSRETAFNFIGDALSQSEIDNIYTRVQTFQTALNRNV